MQQMKVPKEIEVQIDFKGPAIPYRAGILHPVVFKDGKNYCCVLGPDLDDGVFGFGESPEQALQDWDKNLTERIELAGEGDELVSYVNNQLLENTTN
jgi:hypothetical protein